MATTVQKLQPYLEQLTRLCQQHYGERLVSLVVFGSVGRGTPRPDSDIDLLIIARDLPDGRMTRVRDFDMVEASLGKGSPLLSPVFKTPDEVKAGSPLLLDMVDDALVLYDPEGFFHGVIADLRARLQQLNARRIWRGSAWHWDLKPDYQPGETFEI